MFMQITVIGTGFVGVVSAAVFASLGNQVIGLDIDAKKIAQLQKGVVPFYEPGLSEMLLETQKTGRLQFTTDYAEAVAPAELIIIAVGTPSAVDGQADLTYVFAASQSSAPYLKNGSIVAIKSTVPPGTLDQVRTQISAHTQVTFHLASLPEFLKEGSAVEDTLHPDRIIIGADEPEVCEILKNLHEPFRAPMITMKPTSAQMAKYSANAYLATRITFINQIADLCQHNGADVEEVIQGIGGDKRIGSHYWYPGLGYGGSCFPKDVAELAAYSRAVGEQDNLFNQLHALNSARIPKLMALYEQKIGGWKGKKVAVLGLSFKKNTNDMREAPSTIIIPALAQAGATVQGYDPKAVPDVPIFIPELPGVSYTTNLDEAVADADVIMTLVEWPEITSYAFGAHRANKPQTFIDARNQFHQQELEAAGYHYIATGRGKVS
jgi:UDPglucose 6-dehydrogenase